MYTTNFWVCKWADWLTDHLAETLLSAQRFQWGYSFEIVLYVYCLLCVCCPEPLPFLRRHPLLPGWSTCARPLRLPSSPQIPCCRGPCWCSRCRVRIIALRHLHTENLKTPNITPLPMCVIVPIMLCFHPGNMRSFGMGGQQFRQFFTAGNRSSLLGPVPMGMAIKSHIMGFPAARPFHPHARYYNNTTTTTTTTASSSSSITTTVITTSPL